MQLPQPQHDIERVNSITARGVVISDQLTATDHVSYILSACTSLLYAYKYCAAMEYLMMTDRADVILSAAPIKW